MIESVDILVDVYSLKFEGFLQSSFQYFYRGKRGEKDMCNQLTVYELSLH